MGGGGPFSRHDNVYLYIPNLLGYTRVICSLIAFLIAFRYPGVTVGVYLLGFVMDDLDGRAARMFNQSSVFGSVLDMVTDRCSTTGLLVVNAMLYPQYYAAPLALLVLDISSHWFQMTSSHFMGAKTHKDITSRSWLIRQYYRHRLFLGLCCISCETLYLALYALRYPQLRTPALRLPQAVATTLRHVLDAVRGSLHLDLGEFSRLDSVPVAALIALLSLPGVAIKQIVNFKQLVTSIENLVEFEKQRSVVQMQQIPGLLGGEYPS